MFIILSIFFFILLAASAVFGFGWFAFSFIWLWRILFWVFLIGLIISLIVGLTNRGSRGPTNQ